VALARLQTAGAVLTTTEAALFDLMRGAGDAHFKSVSGLVKKYNAEGINEFASDSNI